MPATNLKAWKPATIFAAVVVVLWLVGSLVRNYNSVPSGYVAVYPVLAMWLLTLFMALFAAIFLMIPHTRFLGWVLAFAVISIPCLFFFGVKVSEMAGLNRWIKAPLIRFGPDARASLVVYYQFGATKAQIDEFEDTKLFQARNENRGRDLRWGIREFSRLAPTYAHGHDGFSLVLDPAMGYAQRESLVSVLKDSPLVFRVYRDIVPLAIPDPESKPR
jgi:hypothetical protein